MKIVVLTGAGVSAESGLGTFRDEDGLWTQYALEDVATPEGFARDPALVHDFYNARRQNCLSSAPNPAHFALATLQKSKAHEVVLVTQNVDDLHERAGSLDVVHMHGRLLGALCADCDARWDVAAAMAVDDPCPSCAAPASRPDVVWFGEMPYHMDEIMADLETCDLFAAIGTSGTVYPAAGFVDLARQAGAHTIEINPDPAGGGFDAVIAGPATTAVPDWVKSLVG